MRMTLSEPVKRSRGLGVTSSALSGWRSNSAPMGQARGVSLLLISAAFADVASNIVYVVLVERAFQLGNGTASIGIVLILQAAAQVIFGSWAGGITDKWGFRKAAGMAALFTTPLLFSLALAQNIYFIYFLAFLFMLAKLLLIPARFGLVAQLSDKSRLPEVNTALLIISGAGSFIGPVIAAVFLLTTNNFDLPLLVSGVGWLLSIPPLVMIRVKPEVPIGIRQDSFLDEMWTGWRLIRKRITLSQVLVCLVLVALILGAISPLFTPLSRQLGLGSEGTGIFFSALGFGYLIGPVIATALFKKIRVSTSLLVTGLMAPIGLVFIWTIQTLPVVLIAIALVSSAGAGVNVIVTTIIQRLTPSDHRGSVLGTVQTLIGLAWIVSLVAITGITAIVDADSNVQPLFLMLSSLGFISILTCWIWNQRSIRATCESCEPRFRLSQLACWGLQVFPLGLSKASCGVICDKECPCRF